MGVIYILVRPGQGSWLHWLVSLRGMVLRRAQASPPFLGPAIFSLMKSYLLSWTYLCEPSGFLTPLQVKLPGPAFGSSVASRRTNRPGRPLPDLAVN